MWSAVELRNLRTMLADWPTDQVAELVELALRELVERPEVRRSGTMALQLVEAENVAHVFAPGRRVGLVRCEHGMDAATCGVCGAAGARPAEKIPPSESDTCFLA